MCFPGLVLQVKLFSWKQKAYISIAYLKYIDDPTSDGWPVPVGCSSPWTHLTRVSIGGKSCPSPACYNKFHVIKNNIYQILINPPCNIRLHWCMYVCIFTDVLNTCIHSWKSKLKKKVCEFKGLAGNSNCY